MNPQRLVDHALGAQGGWKAVRRQTADALTLTTGHPEWLQQDYVMAHIKDVWVRQELGPWRAMLRIVPSTHGNPVVAEVRVFPVEPDDLARKAELGLDEWTGAYLGQQATVPGGGVTARTLKAVRIGKAITYATKRLPEHTWSTLWPSRPGPRPRRGGRKPVTDDMLVSVAYAYAFACQKELKAPVPFAAKHHRMTEAKVRDWLRVARERGILKKADSTRPVGALTRKGERLWKARQQKTDVQRKGGKDR